MSSISTNPQKGFSSFDGPTTIRKVKENAYAGISLKWFAILAVWAFVSLFAFLPVILIENWIFRCFIIAFEIAWWVFYISHLRTVELFDAACIKVIFMFDEYSGLHKVYKYFLSVKALQHYFPIVEVFKDGLIEFTYKRYGILLKYIPPEVSEEEWEMHLLNIQAVINRLSGNMMVKFISSSRFGTEPPILKKIQKKLNSNTLSKNQHKILNSVFNRIKNRERVSPDWAYYIFLSFGKCETLEDAQEKILTELPGFLDGLENAGIQVEQIKNRDKVITEYRQFCIPVVIPYV
jgi:hypothetical protein